MMHFCAAPSRDSAVGLMSKAQRRAINMLYSLFEQINQQIVGFLFIEIQLKATLSFFAGKRLTSSLWKTETNGYNSTVFRTTAGMM